MRGQRIAHVYRLTVFIVCMGFGIFCLWQPVKSVLASDASPAGAQIVKGPILPVAAEEETSTPATPPPSPPQAESGQSGSTRSRTPGAVVLREVSLDKPAPAPPGDEEQAPPRNFRESAFPVARAVNLGMVERFTGRLSKEQRRFLQENRFLLIPQEQCLSGASLGMLDLFERIGQDSFYNNTPLTNALFVGPDPFLHALQGYLATRLAYVEKTRLAPATADMLDKLFASAVRLGKVNERVSASFERLEAQFLLPLVLLRSVLPAGKEAPSPGQEKAEEHAATSAGKPAPGSLEHVLEVLKTYQRHVSADVMAAIKMELVSIFSASGSRLSPLLSQHYERPGNGPVRPPLLPVDYSGYLPRGHYTATPLTRCYFRAMRWLEQMGWDLTQPEGMADAVNFALLMSLPVAEEAGAEASENAQTRQHPGGAACDDWQKIMELTILFNDFPAEASYAEWARFLKKYAGVEEFTPKTSVDPAVVKRLREALSLLAPENAHSARLRRPDTQEYLRVFPVHFSLPEFIKKELRRYPDPERAELPNLFSGLWLPAALGNSYAFELLETQAAWALLGEAAAMPSSSSSGDGGAAPQAFEPERIVRSAAVLVQEHGKAAASLRLNVQRLISLLGAQRPEAWGNAASVAGFAFIRSLSGGYGKGMPLYMQSFLFQAKELESIMGAFTQNRHGTRPISEGDFVTASGPLSRVAAYLPVPNGFVEPNLPFWQGMIAYTDRLAQEFAEADLFVEDRLPDGVLLKFRSQLALCARLAEKELRGKKLSQAEYASLRNAFDLRPMIRPPDGLLADADGPAVAQFGSFDGLVVYEANANPYVMLVLVGNEQAPRLTVGVAYNHREFIGASGEPLSDAVWREWLGAARGGAATAMPPLPEKNFWYRGTVKAQGGSKSR